MVLCRSCNVLEQVPPKSRICPALLVRGDTRAFIRFGGVGSQVGASRDDDRDTAKSREEFTRLGSSFFQGRGTILFAIVNKEQNI
jgi:hypothetical protein